MLGNLFTFGGFYAASASAQELRVCSSLANSVPSLSARQRALCLRRLHSVRQTTCSLTSPSDPPILALQSPRDGLLCPPS